MSEPAWQPPDTPDPSEVLTSAAHDTCNGEYERALAKFIWYHHNALRYEPAQSAVRLSFALSYWRELAEIFPAAMNALMQTRDQAETAFREKLDFHSFHDVASMNRYLGDELRTADLFTVVAKSEPTKAERLYRVAEPYLIQAGRFETCGPYLDPMRRVELAAKCYELDAKHESARPRRSVELPKLAKKDFIRNIATLVALLILNGRASEAHAAIDRSREVVDDGESRSVIAAALTGHFPA